MDRGSTAKGDMGKGSMAARDPSFVGGEATTASSSKVAVVVEAAVAAASSKDQEASTRRGILNRGGVAAVAVGYASA